MFAGVVQLKRIRLSYSEMFPSCETAAFKGLGRLWNFATAICTINFCLARTDPPLYRSRSTGPNHYHYYFAIRCNLNIRKSEGRSLRSKFRARHRTAIGGLTKQPDLLNLKHWLCTPRFQQIWNESEIIWPPPFFLKCAYKAQQAQNISGFVANKDLLILLYVTTETSSVQKGRYRNLQFAEMGLRPLDCIEIWAVYNYQVLRTALVFVRDNQTQLSVAVSCM